VEGRKPVLPTGLHNNSGRNSTLLEIEEVLLLPLVKTSSEIMDSLSSAIIRSREASVLFASIQKDREIAEGLPHINAFVNLSTLILL
jgi:hypothetical protein